MVDATRELTTNKTEIDSKDAHLNGPEADVRSQECMCAASIYLSREQNHFHLWKKKCQQK